MELVTDVVDNGVHPLEVERTQQESWNDSVPKLLVVVALLLTYVEHVDVHENFDGFTFNFVKEVRSSPFLNMVVHEEVTTSSKEIPLATIVHPHHIAVHRVPTAPVDGSVTPPFAINSILDPVPAVPVPAFVADSVPVDSNIGTQNLLTYDAVPATVAIVSRSAPIAKYGKVLPQKSYLVWKSIGMKKFCINERGLLIPNLRGLWGNNFFRDKCGLPNYIFP